jgi:hypothetical protein
LINDGLKELYKKVHGDDFKRKPLNPNYVKLKTIMQANLNEMGIEMNVITQNISQTSARRWNTFWRWVKGGFALLIVFFLCKN